MVLAIGRRVEALLADLSDAIRKGHGQTLIRLEALHALVRGIAIGECGRRAVGRREARDALALAETPRGVWGLRAVDDCWTDRPAGRGAGPLCALVVAVLVVLAVIVVATTDALPAHAEGLGRILAVARGEALNAVVLRTTEGSRGRAVFAF